MDYIEWTQRVFDAAMDAWRAAGGSGAVIGMPIDNLAEPLQIVGDPAAFYGSDRHRGLQEAVADLEGVGLLAIGKAGYSPTDLAQLRKDAVLATGWRPITGIPLTEQQEKFLSAAVELAHTQGATYARLEYVKANQVLDASGVEKASHQARLAVALTQELEGKGLVRAMLVLGDASELRPTYAGLVRVTQKRITEDQELINDLLRDWETVETDFKQLLSLKIKEEKAELCRDVLGLVNTKATARRFLVLGFADKEPHAFTSNVDPRNDQDRMENVLSTRCSPLPRVMYRTVPWAGGTAGLLEIIREAEKLPYRATVSQGSLKSGAVYVRHGTHTTEADPSELQSLIDEGDRARAMPKHAVPSG